MQYASILNVDVIANTNAVHVSTHNGIEPNAAIIPEYYITYETSPFRQEKVRPCLWCKSSYRYNLAHNTRAEAFCYGATRLPRYLKVAKALCIPFPDTRCTT